MRFAFEPPRPQPPRSPSLLQEVVNSLLTVVFPADCCLCGNELDAISGAGVCRTCWQNLRPWSGPVCLRCGLPFPTERVLDSSEALCAACRRQEYAFDWARSFNLYSGTLRAAVLQLKFHRHETLGRKLGEVLGTRWSSLAKLLLADVPILVPVPLHPARQRARGYNQAELLAQGLARGLARGAIELRGGKTLRVETGWLSRFRPTVPQTGLDTRARQDNVRGVFALVSPERIRDRTIVLVDDVMTTGATVSACAEVLKGGGARRVLVLTLARATPQFPDIVDSGRGVSPTSNNFQQC